MTARLLRTVFLLAGGLLLAACSGGDAAAEPSAAPSIRPPASAAPSIRPATSNVVAVPVYDFATGPAVLVSAGFEPSTERVDSTGAYLPVNGKPTLVFVDAIW